MDIFTVGKYKFKYCLTLLLLNLVKEIKNIIPIIEETIEITPIFSYATFSVKISCDEDVYKSNINV